MKRILMTGGSGLVGSHLVPLLAEAATLHLVGRQVGGALPESVNFHPLDLSNPFSTGDLPERIDAVIFLAQSDRFREFPEGANDVFAVNVAAPMQLADYARRAGARQFIYASSGAVYDASARPVAEDSAVGAGGPLNFYTASKIAAERLLNAYSGIIDLTLLRLFFAYGPGQKPQMLVPRLIDSVRSGQPVMLQGRDGIRINPIHASDAAAAIAASLRLKGSHTINIAGPEVLSLRDMAEAIGRGVGRAPRYGEAPAGVDLVANTDKMRQIYVAERRFEDGIRTMVSG